MLFSYNFLQSFFTEKLPQPEELASVLNMHFFEVEGVEKINNDYALDVDVLASRTSDCLSHIGLAREIAAITGKNYVVPARKVKEGKEALEDHISISVKESCNRYTLRGISGIKVSSSPKYIQNILTTCGINPINNIVDIANYVMLETGQPLHAFDADKIEGEKITIRKARKREKIVTLDEKRYELPDSIIVIADEQGPLAIAGIKGGVVPEVDENTKNIYLESANFDPVTIRRGSRSIKLRTDASLRFEHGLAIELTSVAVDRAAEMIADIAKGEVLKGVVDYCKEEKVIGEIIFDVNKMRKVLGIDISVKETEKILKRLEFDVRRDGDEFTIVPPYFREDVTIKEDVFEEVGRVYGYDKIQPVFPTDVICSDNGSGFFDEEMLIKRFYKEIGFSETYNHSFVGEDVLNYFKKEELVEVEKPVSLEFKYGRPTLALGLLKNIRENEKNFESVKMFELGKVLRRKEDCFIEEKMIGVVSSTDDFYSFKGKISRFFEEWMKSDVEYRSEEGFFPFASGGTASVYYQDDLLGFFGSVDKKILKEMKINSSVVMAVFSFDNIIKNRKRYVVYQPIYRTPPLIRDIAIIVPEQVMYEEVVGVIKKASGDVLRRAELFDFYQGKEIPQGKKSFALRLYFQLEDGTLNSEDANKLQNKIITSLDNRKEWTVRK